MKLAQRHQRYSSQSALVSAGACKLLQGRKWGGLFVGVIWNQGFFLTAGRDAAGLLGIKEAIVVDRVTSPLKRQSGGSQLASLRPIVDRCQCCRATSSVRRQGVIHPANSLISTSVLISHGAQTRGASLLSWNTVFLSRSTSPHCCCRRTASLIPDVLTAVSTSISLHPPGWVCVSLCCCRLLCLFLSLCLQTINRTEK